VRAIVLSLIVVASLWGHAILKDSTPAAQGVIQGPDAVFRLRFNSRIDASRSRLTVTGDGWSQPVKIASQPAPDTLVGEAKGLGAGHAVLRWQVLALDGHLTRGELPFEIR
jgi:methionine-rich copper-binding protein CopC